MDKESLHAHYQRLLLYLGQLEYNIMDAQSTLENLKEEKDITLQEIQLIGSQIESLSSDTSPDNTSSPTTN